MNKTIKKMLSSALALSMVAASIVLPTTASADYDVTLSYEDGKAVITSASAHDAVLIEAAYSNGVLQSVNPTNVTLTGTEPVEVAATEGSKLMLWNSLAGMEPIADAIIASSSSVTPTQDPGTGGDEQGNVYKFDFGSADNVAEGYKAVSADTAYTDASGYGLLSLTALGDDIEDSTYYDGMDLKKGQRIIVENGAAETVSGADDDWVATGDLTPETDPDYYYGSEAQMIRFAMKIPSENHRYYDAKVTLKRNDASQTAKVNLFSERKHLMLMDEEIPAEGMIYEYSGYVLSAHDKNGGTINDNMVNIVAEGENVAISSIEITMYDEATRGPVLWVFGDSTTTDGSTDSPYFPLRQYTGTGSGLSRYLKKGIAVSNMGQGGLSGSSTGPHFSRAEAYMKEGDFAYYSMGHNEPDTATAINYVSSYYARCAAKGVKFLATSPVERVYTFSDGAYQHTLSAYAEAMNTYVGEQVTAGKTDIAYVGLTEKTLPWYNELVELYGEKGAKFYFFPGDRTHANDAGASNWARMFFEAASENTDATQKAVIDSLFTHLRSDNGVEGLPAAYTVSEDIINAGEPNSANPKYPVVYKEPVPPQEYPYTITKISMKQNDEGALVFDTVDLRRNKNSIFEETNEFTYGKVYIEIYNKETGEVEKTVLSSDWLDITNDSQSATDVREIAQFDDTVTFSYVTQGYRAYVYQVDESEHELIKGEDGKPIALSLIYIADDTPDGNVLYTETFEECTTDPTTGSVLVPGYITAQGAAPAILKEGTNSYFRYLHTDTNNNAKAYRYIEIYPTSLGAEGVDGLLKISFDMAVSSDAVMYLVGNNVGGYTKSPFVPTNGVFASLGVNINGTGNDVNGTSVYGTANTEWLTYTVLLNTVTKSVNVKIKDKASGSVLYSGDTSYLHEAATAPFKGFIACGNTRDGELKLDNLQVSQLATAAEIGSATFSYNEAAITAEGLSFSDVLANTASKTKTVNVALPEGYEIAEVSTADNAVATAVKSSDTTIDVTNASLGTTDVLVTIQKIIAPYVQNNQSFKVSSALTLEPKTTEDVAITEDAPIEIDLAGNASAAAVVNVPALPDGWTLTNYTYTAEGLVTAASDAENPRNVNITATAMGVVAIKADAVLADTAFKTSVEIPVLVSNSKDTTNAKLRDLIVTSYIGETEGVQLISDFDRDVESYGTYKIGKKYTKVVINPVYDGPEGTSHTITLNGAADGVNGNEVTLNGSTETTNTIVVTVTSADTSNTKSYTIVIDNGYSVDEDFGTATSVPSNWNVTNTNDMTFVVASSGAPAGTTGSALHITGGKGKNTDRSAEVAFTDAEFETVKNIEFDVNTTDVGPNQYVLLSFGTDQAVTVDGLADTYLAFASSDGTVGRGKFGYYDYTAKAWVEIANSIGKWLHVSAQIDTAAHTVNLTITGDGVNITKSYTVAEDLTGLNKMVASRTCVSSSSNYETNMWVDNLLIK